MSTAPRYAENHDATPPTPEPPAPEPPPAASPAGAPPHLTDEHYKVMFDTILHPGVFASLVNDLPDGPLRSLFKMWGGLRGLYPAEITHSQYAGRTPAPRDYEIQPMEMPECADVTLAADEVDEVFDALFDALGAWERADEVLEDVEAHRRLGRLLRAQIIANDAWLRSMRPLEHAHAEDRAAAHEWQLTRWMTRSRIEEHRRKQEAAAQATEATHE